jgi:hypothetical protein
VENKDQNNSLVGYGTDYESSVDPTGLHAPPADVNSLSADPEQQPLISQEQPEAKKNSFLRFARRLDVILVAFLIVGLTIAVYAYLRSREAPARSSSTSLEQYDTQSIPLYDLIAGKDLTVSGASNVTINGPLQLTNSFTLTPMLQPTGAKAGQIYYDQTTNQLAYFNGSNFVFLTGPTSSTGGIQSLGGATGQLTLGDGLDLTANQLSNAGVLSVQGEAGDVTFTAGAGLVINGTTFTNSGVISVAAGSPNVTVDSDGSGNLTITVDEPTAGTGTVTSSGSATAGTIPLFTASQNIESSIITQSGLTVTISGDLSVVTGGLSLSNALTVPNGGTGATSLAANGVLVGQGTAAITSVAAGGAGLCLLSTAGAPTWAACPSGSGVTSLNGLAGGLNIANASAAGSTITIDDASTTNKGIASFNGTNFSVSGGAVNTIQDINSSASPTFAGVNTNNVTPNAALTVGVSAQTALLQGSTTTITSNGAGNDIVLNSANAINLLDNTFVSGDITTSGTLAANGGSITSTGALNITPGGALTVGSSSQALTLQGGPTTSLRATSGGNTTVVAFTNPTANTTLNFPALAAGTYTICTTSGNCAGAGVTLQAAYDNSSTPEVVLDATRGALTIRDASTPIGGNLLEVQNNTGSATYLAVTTGGAVVTGTATVTGDINSSTGTIQTNGTTRIDNSGNAVNLGSVTLSGAISGGTTYTGSGNINTTAGAIQTNSTTRIDNSGNLVNIAALTANGNATFQGGNVTVGTSSQGATIVLHDGSSNTGTLQVAALGQDTVYTLPDPGTPTATICLTSGNCAGSGGGVTTSGGTTNRLAKFTGSQAIGDSSISDDGTNVTVTVDVIVQGGDLTLGSTSQPASAVMHDGNGQTTTLQAGNSTGNITFILPTNTGVANQCLKQSGVGNQLVWQDCDGGAGGSSATLQTAYDNSTANPEILLNSSVGAITIRDNSTPIGSVLFNIQDNLGTTDYLAVTVSGIEVEGSTTVTGNINSTTGSIRTNSITRIDNSGNMVNIGNITGSGPITIASIGAGNDITVNGADQFIVQDASVFNALSTFNANIDLGSNDIIGTTSDINLTNFDVAGATGNVTAGTYNGQTISNAANFTGTVTAAGNLTLTAGDIAVNGGDITSSGALNITPGGTLTVGVTGQQLILQGNANTQLTATGSGFTTTVGFTGTPTGGVTYNFDRAAAAGTYTICTTIGNCAGSGGGVTTSGGTTGTIAKFTGSQTLGDSLLSESGSVVTVNGNLNLTSGNQFTVNGTQISSADLSNDANLAKLSASQTFTGATVAFQNGANSTNAFNVQNAGGNRLLTADTTNGRLLLGTASSLDGTLVFNNMSNANTVTILPGTPTANRTLTLPDASGIICTDSGNCAGAGATLQTAYNFSVGGTTPKIKLNSSLLGFDIQDADTTIGANLFNVRASDALGLGSVMFGVGNTGQVTLQNSANSTTALRLLTAAGTSILTGDTTNGQILLGQSGTLNGSLVFRNSTNTNTITINTSAPAANRTITLPDATGTVCLTSGNCASVGGGVTTSGGTTNRLPVFTGAQTLGDSWLNQNTSTLELDSTRNLSLLGGNLTVTGGLTQSSGNFSSTSTGSASLTAGGAITITAGGGSTWSTSSGNLTVQAAGTSTLTMQTGGAGTVALGDQNTTTINIGRGSNIARTINIGTGGTSTAQTITIGSTGGASATTLQAGTGNLQLLTNSASASIIVRSNTNAANAFQVQRADGTALLNINTTSNITTLAGDLIATGIQPASVATNGTNGSNHVVTGAKGGNTSGTTGQTGGTGGSVYLTGGAGGNASTGSTNGWGGHVILEGGAPGSGTGSAGLRGNVILQPTAGVVGIGTISPNFIYRLDVAGDINISSGSSYRINGTAICTSSGCTPAAGSGNYIQNQTASIQTGNFRLVTTGDTITTAIIRTNGTQTADLLQFQSSSGGPVAGIRPSGSIWSAPITDPNTDVPSNARLFVQPLSNASTAIIARAAAGGAPTGDILQLQSATGSSTYFSVGAAGAVTSQVGTTSTAAFDIKDTTGDSLLRVDTTNNMVKIGYESGTLNGANASLVIGDDCGGDNSCVSIFEGNGLNGGAAGDSDVIQVQGAAGIRFSTDYAMNSTMVLTDTGRVGIGTEDPSETLSVVGNLSIQDAATATKNYRFRTSGGALDIEGAGADLFFSSWTGANFTGTQKTFLRGYIGSSGSSYNNMGLFVGDGGSSATPMVLVLHKKTSASGTADPTSTNYNGAMYYNEALDRFRCYQAAQWQDCIGSPVIDWTNVSIQSPAADGGAGNSTHRVRRLSTGQVEFQLDVAISGSTSGVQIATLPTWARPTDDTLRYNPATTASGSLTFNAHVDIRTDGSVYLYSGNFSSLPWIGLTAVYTP